MKPWTEAHQREGAIALCEEARAALLRGDAAASDALAFCPTSWARSEKYLRAKLEANLGAAAAKRVLRRVRALAEGRLARETTYRVGASHYRFPEGLAEARFESKGVDYPVYRSARIRKAVPR